jgi:hypothetical protein
MLVELPAMLPARHLHMHTHTHTHTHTHIHTHTHHTKTVTHVPRLLVPRAASERDVPVSHPDLPSLNTILKLMLAGTAPVDGHPELLSHAVAEHAHNYDMAERIREPLLLCKDGVLATDNEGKRPRA